MNKPELFIANLIICLHKHCINLMLSPPKKSSSTYPTLYQLKKSKKVGLFFGMENLLTAGEAFIKMSFPLMVGLLKMDNLFVWGTKCRTH